jgi:hypothetical protein
LFALDEEAPSDAKILLALFNSAIFAGEGENELRAQRSRPTEHAQRLRDSCTAVLEVMTRE